MGIYKQAIEQLAPDTRFSFSSDVESYESLVWKDTTPQPTKDVVETKVSELRPQWNQWEIDRKSAYPTVEEQLDLLWHTVNNGQQIVQGSKWFEVIKQAKNNTPKPE